MIVEILGLALRSLVRNPLRTGLTVLGFAIGVAAFIAMISFGRGARASVLGQFEKLGVNIISVNRDGARPGGRPPSWLTEKDVETLKRQRTLIRHAAPLLSADAFVTWNQREHVTTLKATHPDYARIHDWPCTVGGMFDAWDLGRAEKVCVLGATPRSVLFGSTNPVGEVIEIDGVLRCRVIGVLKAKGSATSGRDLDDIIMLPASTYHTHLAGHAPRYWVIVVRPEPGVERDVVNSFITDALRHNHKLTPADVSDFTLRSNDDAIKVAGEVSVILTRLLAGIAAVSLLVGGIGIMNIQLVSVMERTQEIGIRAAIGASPSQIMRQFLLEAVLLAMVGTLLGALVGSGISLGVAYGMRWPLAVPAEAMAGAVLFGAGVGVFFGYLPARRAANLDPIIALRRE
ncbi:MAG: ABC transporter permease [Myxococcota bacterium]